MPRPADETMSGNGGGFGPAPGTSENLGQIDVGSIHDLDVDGATENALKLAAVFSKGVGVASKAVQGQIDKTQSDAEKQGELDGTTGNVDQNQMNASVYGMASQYATGVARAQTTLAATTAAAKAHALFEANPNTPLLDSTDANGNKVPGLHTQIDNIFANALPGADQDPVKANIVAPIMTHTLNEITGLAYQHKVQQDQQTAEDAQTGLLLNDIHTGSNLFSVPYAMDSLSKVYGGDPRLAREALTHVVGEAAVQAGNPSLIDKYLPSGIDFGNGATLTPQDGAYLDAARNRATEAGHRVNQQAAQSAANNIADSMLAGKDPTALLHNYLAIPGANATEALDMYNWYYRRGKESAADSIDNDHNTWDMDRALASGDITSGSQLIGWLSQRGIGNTKSGNQLLQRGMGNLRAFQSTNADDPDFRAGLSFVGSTYKPGVNPVTGKFLNDAANSQQAGAMVDYRTLYQQNLKIPGTSATDAARRAQKSVMDKYGDPVESTTRKPGALPKTYADEVDAVRQAPNNPKTFLDSNISGNDIATMRDSNLITQEEAANAARVRLSRLKQPRTQ